VRPWLLLLAAAVAPGAELSLTALDGAPQSLRSLQKTPVTVLVFLSAQCPVSNEYVGRLNALANEYAGQATFLGVNANHNESVEQARQHATEYRLAFPVYKDPGNAAADEFGATVTPEAIVLDGENRVRYRGRIDDSQKPARVKRSDLRLAVEAALAGRAAPNEEARAFGCTIKRSTVELASIADAAGYRAVLASHRGKVVLVNFWATWCAPCLEEMPLLAALER
jgi:thiol-disulfide isomerase/thioredoxin